MGVDWVAVSAIGTSLTAIATAATVAVALFVFVKDSRQRAEFERLQRRHDAVSRVLDAMQVAVRKQLRPAFVRAWSKAEVEYLFGSVRLLHDLQGADDAVPTWAMRRIQDMLNAKSDKESRSIGIDIGAKLVDWNRGKISTDWFAAEVERQPLSPQFKVSGRNRILRSARQTFESAVAVSVMMGTSLAVLTGGLSAVRLLRGLGSRARDIRRS